MRRLLIVMAAAMLIGATIAVPVAAREKTTSLKVAAATTAGNHARIQLMAALVHVPDRTPRKDFVVKAVAHFSTGDVEITLKRLGRSFVAAGRIAVPAGNTLRLVPVDVTATLNGSTYSVTKTVRVKVPKATPPPSAAPVLPEPDPSPTPFG